jgi:hypothetical protein
MGEKAAKVENFGTYLSEVPVTSTDRGLLQLSALVMGHLVRSNVQLTAALVDNEVPPPPSFSVESWSCSALAFLLGVGAGLPESWQSRSLSVDGGTLH